MQINPELDIVLERALRAPPALIWRCWAEPALLAQWYLPKPYAIDDSVVDLRPGGRFYMRMSGPEGQGFTSEGCVLEVVEARKLVFTDLMGEDFAPFATPDISAGPSFTAILTLAPQGDGTVYRMVARHASADAMGQNRASGFEEGWAIAVTQLEELALGL